MTGSLPRQSLHASDADRARLWAGALLALGLHALIAFGLPRAIVTPAEFSMQTQSESVEVELIEKQAEAAVPELPQPPPPTPVVVPEAPPPAPIPEVREIPMAPPPPAPPLPKEETVAKIEEQPAPPVEVKPAPPPPKPVKAPAPAQPAAATSKAANPVTPTGAAGASGATSRPSALYNPPPSYPTESKRANEEGAVLLSVQVNAAGRADSITVSKSSGFQRLDRAASEAVRRWKFKPATRNGEPIATIVDVPIVFRLKQ
jgi:protein TonB